MKLIAFVLYSAYFVQAGKKVRRRHRWQNGATNHNTLHEMVQVKPYVSMPLSTGPPVVPFIPDGYVPPPQSRNNFVSKNGITCGVPPGSRIVGGFNVNNRAFPWQVMVKPGNDTHHQSHLCGGSIITNKHVLTAAHCMENKTPAGSYVFAGLDDVPNVMDISNFFNVIAFKNHESYTGEFSSSGFDFDISILTVNKDFPFSAASYPICLPPNDQCLADETKVQASGYGRVQQSNNRGSQLKGLNSEIDKHYDCYTRLFYRSGINLTPNNICLYATFMGTTCQGDSGGPMTWKDDTDTAYVIGVVSYSLVGCGNKGQPLVFERVNRHLQWIKDNTGIIYDNYNDLSAQTCVETHTSVFGSGLAGNGVETREDRSTKVNDIQNHIKFSNDASKCFQATEFVLFQPGQKVLYSPCTNDYRSEWVYRPTNKQIASSGDGDTFCWNWIKTSKTTSTIKLKACDNKDKKQKFSFDQNANSLYIIHQRKKQYLAVSGTSVIMKPAKVVPQNFKARVHGETNDLEYQIKFTLGKVNNKCIRRYKNSLKFGTCGANPYVNPHGFEILENRSNKDGALISISFKNRQSGLCLHRAIKKKKKFMALKPCNVVSDLQMFKDIRGSEDDFKLCHPSEGYCVGYETKKGKLKWGVFVGPESIIDGTE